MRAVIYKHFSAPLGLFGVNVALTRADKISYQKHVLIPKPSTPESCSGEKSKMTSIF